MTPEKRESGSDSGESSDSGVSTPPPADLKIEKVSLIVSPNSNRNSGAKADSLRVKRNPQANKFSLNFYQETQKISKTFAQQNTGQTELI